MRNGSWPWSFLAPPLLVGLTLGFITIVPIEVIGGLLAWLLVSLPIGVLIGHCALSDR